MYHCSLHVLTEQKPWMFFKKQYSVVVCFARLQILNKTTVLIPQICTSNKLFCIIWDHLHQQFSHKNRSDYHKWSYLFRKLIAVLLQASKSLTSICCSHYKLFLFIRLSAKATIKRYYQQASNLQSLASYLRDPWNSLMPLKIRHIILKISDKASLFRNMTRDLSKPAYAIIVIQQA